MGNKPTRCYNIVPRRESEHSAEQGGSHGCSKHFLFLFTFDYSDSLAQLGGNDPNETSREEVE